MGQLSFNRGDRVYLDANICIYQLEGVAEYAEQLAKLRRTATDVELELLTSELTLAEALVPAYRTDDEERARLYTYWLESGNFVHLMPTTRDVYRIAARLRAQLRLKTPDAIHVASAVVAECRFIVTNDLAIRVPAELVIVPIAKL